MHHVTNECKSILGGKRGSLSLGLHRARCLPKYTIICTIAKVEQKKLKDRAPSWKLEIPGTAQHKDALKAKLQSVREKLSRKLQSPVTYAHILDTVLDSWLEHHSQEKPACPVSGHTPLDYADCNQEIFMVAKSSMKKLLEMGQAHARACDAELAISAINYRGHVAACKLRCKKDKSNSYMWASSPVLPTAKYLVNERVNHGFTCSGMLPSHYRRLSGGAGIGTIRKDVQNEFFTSHKESIEAEYNESLETALQLEIGMYDLPQEDEGPGWHGINIMSDARHGWRKNAKDTSVVTIGEKSHQVLHHAHVTKQDDHVTQRHEKVGTEKMYEYLQAKDTPVAVHIHDRNMAINKLIKDKDGPVNQNDSWHGYKGLKKDMQTIASGPKYKMGVTWHTQLEDKVEPVIL